MATVARQRGYPRMRFTSNGVRTYEDRYLVVSDMPIGPLEAITANGIPSFGTTYNMGSEADQNALLESLDASPVDQENTKYEVTCRYSSESSSDSQGASGTQSIPPWTKPAELEFGFQVYSKAIDRDLNGDAITNSKNKPFSDLAEIDDARPVFTVTKSQLIFPASLAASYQNAINSDNWSVAGITVPKKTAKVAGISGRTASFDGQQYWVVTYEFHLRQEEWTLKLLDHEIDDNGNIVLLDGNGNTTQTPTFLEFEVYPEKPFTGVFPF